MMKVCAEVNKYCFENISTFFKLGHFLGGQCGSGKWGHFLGGQRGSGK